MLRTLILQIGPQHPETQHVAVSHHGLRLVKRISNGDLIILETLPLEDIVSVNSARAGVCVLQIASGVRLPFHTNRAPQLAEMISRYIRLVSANLVLSAVERNALVHDQLAMVGAEIITARRASQPVTRQPRATPSVNCISSEWSYVLANASSFVGFFSLSFSLLFRRWRTSESAIHYRTPRSIFLFFYIPSSLTAVARYRLNIRMSSLKIFECSLLADVHFYRRRIIIHLKNLLCISILPSKHADLKENVSSSRRDLDIFS